LRLHGTGKRQRGCQRTEADSSVAANHRRQNTPIQSTRNTLWYPSKPHFS
jgi:hypothetical protein